MPIKVACSCGQNLAAPDTLAGKKAKCPKCGQLIAIPASSSAGSGGSFDDLLDEAGMKASRTGVRCPSCNAEMPREAVLCVQCGYDVQRAKHIQTVTEDDEEKDKKDEFAGQFEPHGVPQLDEAEREMLRLKRQEKMLRKGAPVWAIFAALAVTVFFLVRMVTAPQDQAMSESGYAVIGAAGLSALAYLIILTVIAFRERMQCGLLFLFVPFYWLYYVITRWTKCRPAFNSLLLSGVALGLGVGMLMLAPKLAEEKKKEGDPAIKGGSETAYVLPMTEPAFSPWRQPTPLKEAQPSAPPVRV